MGNFYTNVTLRGPAQPEVAAAVRRAGRRAYVAPTRRGLTTVYDERSESQDPRELGGVAAALSAEWRCPALAALNHDDDILALALYERGALVSEYDSSAPAGVRVAPLCRAFDALGLAPVVWGLLRGPRPVFEVLRHAAVVWALGLPPWSVGSGFRYITRGEAPRGLDIAQLARTWGEGDARG